MIEHADVIVVGSGALGAATAFYLVKRGAGTVALVDKHDIGSQTSPRAAGMVNCVRTSDLMVELIKLAVEGIRRFTQETGQPLDWVHSGSLKVARRPQDAEVIEHDLGRGRRLGLDVERVSPQDAHGLNPFLEADGVVAVMRVGDDMYFDPRRSPSASRAAPRRQGPRCCRIRRRHGSSSSGGESLVSTPTTVRSGRRSSSTPPAHGRARSLRPAGFGSRSCRPLVARSS